jgi:ubiquinone/menaquinone biosynthesis C-methylase UbiE
MIKMCRKKGYKVRSADAGRLPCKSGIFELVVAKDLIEHFQENVAVLRELIRVSKKYVFVSAVGPVPEFACVTIPT